MTESKHFDNIIELQSYLHETDERSYLSHLHSQLYPKSHVWVKSSRTNESKGRIIPIGLGSFLYRGQTQIYEPCIPSIFRIKPSREELIENLLKIAEFRLLCLSHPGVQKCLEFGLDVDFIGLAQHYGLKTSYLDLTQSIDISSFFATCEKNTKGTIKPRKKGVGIIYRIRHGVINSYSPTIVIGKQPFKRPEAQKAWSIDIDLGWDFSKLKGVEIFTFDHSYDCSKQIFKYFNKGKKLFPKDIIENKVKQINKLETFSKKAHETLLNSKIPINKQIISNKVIKLELNQYPPTKLSESSQVSFSSFELKKLASDWEKKGNNFLKGVGAIFACEDINATDKSNESD